MMTLLMMSSTVAIAPIPTAHSIHIISTSVFSLSYWPQPLWDAKLSVETTTTGVKAAVKLAVGLGLAARLGVRAIG